MEGEIDADASGFRDRVQSVNITLHDELEGDVKSKVPPTPKSLSEETFVPKTELGRKLWGLRQKYIAAGGRLYTDREIADELDRRACLQTILPGAWPECATGGQLVVLAASTRFR